MSTPLEKITARAKKIRLESPKTKWTAAVKKASAEYRAGTLGKVSAVKNKKKVSGVTKVITVPRKRVGAVKVSAVKKAVPAKRVGAIGRIGKATALLGSIKKLEEQRKKAGKDLKPVIQVVINGMHDKLDKLKKAR